MSLHVLRGMRDILPPETKLWEEIESKARQFFSLYGYEEIRTPLLEEMGLFTRSIGETTNVVEKEMYVFQDRKEKWVALRPEGTASVVRAYLESNRPQQEMTARYFYFGPMYRYERPQKGRYRQFHQIGVEIFGIQSPRLDAEVIHMLDLFFRKKMELSDIRLEINSLGCPICRPKFQAAFLSFLLKHEASLCGDCKRRMEKNPLRSLDCKEEGCQNITNGAPSIQEFLCEVCEKDFDTVLETLGQLGTQYQINQKIVRGLDYYQKTTFEFTSTALGAQNAVAGGGRYDGLVRLMGGPNVPGLGFAIGLERLVETLQTVRQITPTRTGVFIAPIGDYALKEAMHLAGRLREQGHAVQMDFDGKSLKAQMRLADKLGARYVVILGDEEIKKKKIIVRNMENQEQKEVPFDSLAILE